MIPEKYNVGNKNLGVNQIVDGKRRNLIEGVDVLAWLEDIEDRSTRNKNNLQSVGRILNPFKGVAILQGNKKVEIGFYEDNKPLSEVVKDIKDPEKEMLKVHDFMEFVICNLLGGVGPDGKKMDPNKKRQIFKNALKKIEEEEKKEEKVPQTPPKEEKKKR